MSEDERNSDQEENQESMDSTLTKNMSDQGFWKEMWHQIRLAWFLVRSPDVPIYLKVLPALAVIYVLIPTDLIPDVFPVIGQLDDLTALIVGAKVFIELSPQDVVNRHIRSMRQQTQVASLLRLKRHSFSPRLWQPRETRTHVFVSSCGVHDWPSRKQAQDPPKSAKSLRPGQQTWRSISNSASDP